MRSFVEGDPAFLPVLLRTVNLVELPKLGDALLRSTLVKKLVDATHTCALIPRSLHGFSAQVKALLDSKTGRARPFGSGVMGPIPAALLLAVFNEARNRHAATSAEAASSDGSAAEGGDAPMAPASQSEGVKANAGAASKVLSKEDADSLDIVAHTFLDALLVHEEASHMAHVLEVYAMSGMPPPVFPMGDDGAPLRVDADLATRLIAELNLSLLDVRVT